MILRGAFTALVTPFRGGHFDDAQFAKQIAHQAKNKIDGIIPVGTTGESPTLSHAEHHRVVEAAIHAARGTGMMVIAGTGSNATDEAIDLTRHARQAGADAALLVNPYYNKPSQEGLYRHFKEISRAVDIPIVLYNIPGRTGISMTVATMVRLAAECPNIVAVKDAAGNLDLTSEAVCAGMQVLSGDDSLTLPMISVGAQGVISVVSNIVPDRVRGLVHAALAGDIAKARADHLALFPLIKALFVETNPIPVKAAMALLGMDTGDVRLPLCEPTPASLQVISDALKKAGLATSDPLR